MHSKAFQACFPLLLLTILASCQPTSKPNPAAVEEDSNKATLDSIEKAPKASESNAQTTEGDRTPNKNPDKNSTVDQVTLPEAILPALLPGEYCYAANTEVENINVRFNIDATDRIVGNVQGAIQDKSAEQYTDYRQTLNGTIDGSNLNLDIATWIEYDQQNEQATWKVSEQTLQIDNNTLAATSCETVSKAFQNEEGLEASDLTSNASLGIKEQIYFESGKNSTTISESVLESYRDIYAITAQGGQQLSLSIRSKDNNAVFNVVTPSGSILGTELTQKTFSLPHTGDYQIIVGANRGNATYDLEISVD